MGFEEAVNTAKKEAGLRKRFVLKFEKKILVTRWEGDPSRSPLEEGTLFPRKWTKLAIAQAGSADGQIVVEPGTVE